MAGLRHAERHRKYGHNPISARSVAFIRRNRSPSPVGAGKVGGLIALRHAARHRRRQQRHHAGVHPVQWRIRPGRRRRACAAAMNDAHIRRCKASCANAVLEGRSSGVHLVQRRFQLGRRPRACGAAWEDTAPDSISFGHAILSRCLHSSAAPLAWAPRPSLSRTESTCVTSA